VLVWRNLVVLGRLVAVEEPSPYGTAAKGGRWLG
jgi:hypothetical protein